jgi:hypothetical protein
MEERIKEALKVIENEIFMRNLVFKNKPSIKKKKVAEMEKVKELIEEMAKRIEAIELIGE